MVWVDRTPCTFAILDFEKKICKLLFKASKKCWKIEIKIQVFESYQTLQ